MVDPDIDEDLDANTNADADTNTAVPLKRVDKGKGKAKAIDLNEESPPGYVDSIPQLTSLLTHTRGILPARGNVSTPAWITSCHPRHVLRADRLPGRHTSSPDSSDALSSRCMSLSCSSITFLDDCMYFLVLR